MFALLLCLLVADEAQDTSVLGGIVSFDKLENGTDAERIDQLRVAHEKIVECRFSPTPTEFKIVSSGLTHENPAVRAGSARLLEQMAASASSSVANGLAQESLRRDTTNDDQWLQAAFFMVHRPEIPGHAAYRAFQKYFRPGRICGTDHYANYRPSFKLSDHLLTGDLTVLKYALSREIRQRQRPREPDELGELVSHRLRHIVDYCADEATQQLAQQLLELDQTQTSR